MAMPTFWELVERAKQDTGASEAWILKSADMNHGAFSAWRSRGIPVLPPRRNLLLLARALRVDYEYLIDVILHDTEYLPGRVALENEAESRRWAARGNPKGERSRPSLKVAAYEEDRDIEDEQGHDEHP